MELLPAPVDPVPVLNHAAAEERLLARYDRPAKPLILEPWEAELLGHVLQAWRTRRTATAHPPLPAPALPTLPRSSGRELQLRGSMAEETGPDRFARRVGLEPWDSTGPI